jgi:hypothetical protein
VPPGGAYAATMSAISMCPTGKKRGGYVAILALGIQGDVLAARTTMVVERGHLRLGMSPGTPSHAAYGDTTRSVYLRPCTHHYHHVLPLIPVKLYSVKTRRLRLPHVAPHV